MNNKYKYQSSSFKEKKEVKKRNQKNYNMLKKHVNKQHNNRVGFGSMKNSIEIDASTMSFGRVCSEAAKVLIGKDNFFYKHNQFNGCPVVIKNPLLSRFTGNKANKYKVYWHTGYPGGIKNVLVSERIAKGDFEKMYKRVIGGMLPDNKIFAKAVKYCVLFS